MDPAVPEPDDRTGIVGTRDERRARERESGSGNRSINWRAIPRSAGTRSRVWRGRARCPSVDHRGAAGPRSQAGRRSLLRLLSAARPARRAAARAALRRIEGAAGDCDGGLTATPAASGEDQPNGTAGCASSDERSDANAGCFAAARAAAGAYPGHPGRRPGPGSIVVSVTAREQRRTAAFLCDVRRGIRDVVGEVEPESPAAGGLIDALDQQPEGGCVRDVPELALGLLAGCLMLVWAGRARAGARLARRDARARVSASRISGDDPRPGRKVRSPARKCRSVQGPCSTPAHPGWIARR